MRLLTHNVLRNTAKDATEGFPLKIEAAKVDVSAAGVEGMHALYSRSRHGLITPTVRPPHPFHNKPIRCATRSATWRFCGT